MKVQNNLPKIHEHFMNFSYKQIFPFLFVNVYILPKYISFFTKSIEFLKAISVDIFFNSIKWFLLVKKNYYEPLKVKTWPPNAHIWKCNSARLKTFLCTDHNFLVLKKLFLLDLEWQNWTLLRIEKLSQLIYCTCTMEHV